MKMKAILATAISLALTTVVIGNAYYQKKQFYPSIVYLTNSNPSMAVSMNILPHVELQINPPLSCAYRGPALVQ